VPTLSYKINEIVGNRNVFSSGQKVARDVAVVMSSGSEFYNLEADGGDGKSLHGRI